MPERSKIAKTQADAIWKGMSDADRRFISAMIVINEAIVPNRGTSYHPLEPAVENLLKRCNRRTLFSIATECVGLLTRAPALRRVKAAHRELGGKSPPPPKNGARERLRS